MKAKHILRRTVIAAWLTAGFAGAPAFGAATEPLPGVFGSFDYVASASGSDCTVSADFYSSGHLTWPGAGKLGATWRYQPNGPEGPFVKKVTYPKTPQAGSTTWSGTENIVFYPGRATSTTTFDAIITYIDADSFVMTRTVSYGNCTEKIFSSFVRD
jgi:hypothetical protein